MADDDIYIVEQKNTSLGEGIWAGRYRHQLVLKPLGASQGGFSQVEFSLHTDGIVLNDGYHVGDRCRLTLHITPPDMRNVTSPS